MVIWGASVGVIGNELGSLILATVSPLFLANSHEPWGYELWAPWLMSLRTELPPVMTITALGVGVSLIAFTLPPHWNIPVLILALLGLLNALYNPLPFPWQAPLCGGIAALLISTLLSLVGSPLAQHALWANLYWLPALLLFGLATLTYRSAIALDSLAMAMTLLTAMLSGQLLWVAASAPAQHPSAWVEQLNSALIAVPNDLALVAVIAPLSALLAFRSAARAPWLSLFVVAILSAGWVTMVIYQSGIAAMAMALTLFALLACWRWRLALISLAAVSALALAIDALMGWPLLAKYLKFINHLDARTGLWVAAWLMFVDAPLLGHGPNTFGSIYLVYLQQATLPEWIATDFRHTPWPHNLFLELLAERGLVGFSAFMFLFFMAFSKLYRLVKRSDTALRQWAIALSCSGIGFCFTALFELSFKRLWVLLVVFLFLGIITAIDSPIRSTKPLQEDGNHEIG